MIAKDGRGDNGVKNPGHVLPGSDSQKPNETGLHWLRISIRRCHLALVRQFLSVFFGKSAEDGYGLWSYDSRYTWPCGVSLNYDASGERATLVHKGKATLDCPGSALDSLASKDLRALVVGLRDFGAICTRIDVFLDDYSDSVTPSELAEIGRRGDVSGYRVCKQIQRFRVGGELEHDEVAFGRRGKMGSGKYTRAYNKKMESGGEQACLRFETEFTGKRADAVYQKLAQIDNDAALAVLCGSLVVGSITFIRRMDRNLSRNELYAFWQQIRDRLGVLVVRVERTEPDVETMSTWVKKQVTPTLACLRAIFEDDCEFLNWLLEIVIDGEERMNIRHINIIKEAFKQAIAGNQIRIA